MSWIKSISVSGDDVFDEDADDISLQNKEWKHNMEKRVKDGYVEGIDAAKETFLQVGFNLGYKEGAHKTVALGRLKGTVSAIQCWCRQRPAPHNSIPVSVSGLLQRVDQHEERLMKEMRQALERPPATASTVSDSLEDLGVHPGEEDGCRAPGRKDEGSTVGGGEGGGCCGGKGCGRLEGGGGECGKESGADGGGGECNKTDCCRKGGEEKMELGPCSRASSSSTSSNTSSRSFRSSESLHALVQECQELVEELGLPQELIVHLQSLKGMV